MAIYKSGDIITVDLEVLGNYDTEDPNFSYVGISGGWLDVNKHHDVAVYKSRIVGHKPRKIRDYDIVKAKGNPAKMRVIEVHGNKAWVKWDNGEPFTIDINNLEHAI